MAKQPSPAAALMTLMAKRGGSTSLSAALAVATVPPSRAASSGPPGVKAPPGKAGSSGVAASSGAPGVKAPASKATAKAKAPAKEEICPPKGTAASPVVKRALVSAFPGPASKVQKQTQLTVQKVPFEAAVVPPALTPPNAARAPLPPPVVAPSTPVAKKASPAAMPVLALPPQVRLTSKTAAPTMNDIMRLLKQATDAGGIDIATLMSTMLTSSPDLDSGSWTKCPSHLCEHTCM
jgi:hypothetical protein